jgi:hypothetical protein
LIWCAAEGLIDGRDTPLTVVLPLATRAGLALYSGLMYGYALLLMLVAMAYNPGLFICLIVGHALGELAFNAEISTASIKRSGGHCGSL